jgi:hypothetical protein
MTTLKFADSDSLAKNQAFGAVFGRKRRQAFYMRVKPVNYLLNSTLIVDKINSGDVLVVRLDTATVAFIDGNEIVIPVTSATMSIIK